MNKIIRSTAMSLLTGIIGMAFTACDVGSGDSRDGVTLNQLDVTVLNFYS